MRVCAVLFGGYMAKQEQVDRWLASARKQKPGIEFGVRPWPTGAAKSDGQVGLDVFKQTRQFESVVAALKASPADKIYIVGHSSGCAIANAVDSALKDSKVASKLVFVSLDGYRPGPDQLFKRDNTQIWGLCPAPINHCTTLTPTRSASSERCSRNTKQRQTARRSSRYISPW